MKHGEPNRDSLTTRLWRSLTVSTTIFQPSKRHRPCHSTAGSTFSRIDNGKIMFYELDLPDVIALRAKLIEDSERHQSIASSFLDTAWLADITADKGLLFLAGGVFYYFDEQKIREFFTRLADTFDECELYFDVLSPLGLRVGKKQVLKKSGMDMSLNEGWALKSARTIETWDSRLHVLESAPLYQGMHNGLPLPTRLMFIMTDILKVCSMVHLRIAAAQ